MATFEQLAEREDFRANVIQWDGTQNGFVKAFTDIYELDGEKVDDAVLKEAYKAVRKSLTAKNGSDGALEKLPASIDGKDNQLITILPKPFETKEEAERERDAIVTDVARWQDRFMTWFSRDGAKLLGYPDTNDGFNACIRREFADKMGVDERTLRLAHNASVVMDNLRYAVEQGDVRIDPQHLRYLKADSLRAISVLEPDEQIEAVTLIAAAAEKTKAGHLKMTGDLSRRIVAEMRKRSLSEAAESAQTKKEAKKSGKAGLEPQEPALSAIGKGVEWKQLPPKREHSIELAPIRIVPGMNANDRCLLLYANDENDQQYEIVLTLESVLAVLGGK